jgi:hypothetical protein
LSAPFTFGIADYLLHVGRRQIKSKGTRS